MHNKRRRVDLSDAYIVTASRRNHWRRRKTNHRMDDGGRAARFDRLNHCNSAWRENSKRNFRARHGSHILPLWIKCRNHGIAMAAMVVTGRNRITFDRSKADCNQAALKPMPHRILASDISLAVETILLGIVAGWHGMLAVTEFISEKDWARLLGEDGFKAALLIGLAVVWCRAEKAKDQRHKELVTALAARDTKDEARMEQFVNLSAESIKAQAKVVGAIEAFDKNSQRLAIRVEELADQIRDNKSAA